MLLIAILGGCQLTAGGEPVSVEVPDTYWPDIYYPGFDQAVDALDLRPLRLAGRLPDAEIRVWLTSNTVPDHLWLLQRSTSQWSGQLYLYWDRQIEYRDREFRQWRRRLKRDAKRFCRETEQTRYVLACVGQVDSNVDWNDVASQLDDLYIWTLPDESEIDGKPYDTFDGWSITVELHNGAHFRAYQYSNPRGEVWEPSKNPEAIADLFRSLGPKTFFKIDAYGRRVR